MTSIRNALVAIGSLALVLPAAAASAQAPDEQAAMAQQREALKPLAWLNGAWRGVARMSFPGGTREIVQTERVGDLLGGAVKVVEGRGYNAAGATVFNALGVISYDAAGNRIVMRSHAQGRSGEFTITPLAEGQGFSWEIPAGPAVIRYVARLDCGRWIETGDRIVPGRDPVRFIEMTLDRLGDSDWPAGGAVPAR